MALSWAYAQRHRQVITPAGFASLLPLKLGRESGPSDSKPQLPLPLPTLPLCHFPALSASVTS